MRKQNERAISDLVGTGHHGDDSETVKSRSKETRFTWINWHEDFNAPTISIFSLTRQLVELIDLGFILLKGQSSDERPFARSGERLVCY